MKNEENKKREKNMKWEKVEEDGTNYWINEEIGNIVQLKDNEFVVLYPRVIKLGPFSTVEQAQAAIMDNKDSIDIMIKNFNLSLVEATKDLEK